MAVEFRLPDLGEGMTEGELVRWLVKPGDRVKLDQAIAEVQTDKAVVELPAPVPGTILSLDVEEGRVVPVGTRLLTIEDAAQNSVPTIPTSGEVAAVAAAESAGASAAADGGGRWSAVSVAPQRRALATPAVRRLARELGVDITTIGGSGPAGRVLAEDVRAAATGAPTDAVTTRDLEAATAAATAPEREERSAAVAREARAVEMPGAEEGPAEERLPLRGLRRRIAENMVLSVSTIPQVTSLVEVDSTALVVLRRSVVPAAVAGRRLSSYLRFVAIALVLAFLSYPYLHRTIDEGTREI